MQLNTTHTNLYANIYKLIKIALFIINRKAAGHASNGKCTTRHNDPIAFYNQKFPILGAVDLKRREMVNFGNCEWTMGLVDLMRRPYLFEKANYC